MVEQQLEFSKESFAEFKDLYKKCIKCNIDTFIFQKKEVLVSYAKYVIQYLEQTKFKNLKEEE